MITLLISLLKERISTLDIFKSFIFDNPSKLSTTRLFIIVYNHLIKQLITRLTIKYHVYNFVYNAVKNQNHPAFNNSRPSFIALSKNLFKQIPIASRISSSMYMIPIFSFASQFYNNSSEKRLSISPNHKNGRRYEKSPFRTIVY